MPVFEQVGADLSIKENLFVKPVTDCNDQIKLVKEMGSRQIIRQGRLVKSERRKTSHVHPFSRKSKNVKNNLSRKTCQSRSVVYDITCDDHGKFLQPFHTNKEKLIKKNLSRNLLPWCQPNLCMGLRQNQLPNHRSPAVS